MHRQLLVVNRIAKIIFEPDAFEKTHPQFLCKQRNAGVHFLGVVHRNVGVAQDVFGRVVFGIAGCDADVYADRDAIAVERERLRNAVKNAASDFFGFTRCREVFEDYRKFISADAGDRIRWIEHADKPLRRGLQNLVA